MYRKTAADTRLQRLESQLEAASAMIQKQSITLQKTIERMATDKKVYMYIYIYIYR
jgi:hypothetical protein